ncbi:MAG: Ig-like domain-containing protein [Anaerolineaceae bacterium]|nr:Ig-like domain-containing protein [Anaerolineaceae bacterium]
MEMKKKVLILVLLAGFLSLVNFQAVSADAEPAFTLGLKKVFGYGGFGNDIQGTFRLKLNGPLEKVKEVNYYLDDTLLGSVTTNPFTLDFDTEKFEPGGHKISAQVILRDAPKITTPTLAVEILSKDSTMKKVTSLLLPLMAVVIGATVFGTVISARSKPPKPGQKTEYNGMYGAAVCPNCGHPFARSPFGFNLGFKRLERCPSCKKWVSTKRASTQELEAAEMAEAKKYGLQQPYEGENIKTDDKLTKMVDESRYLDE